METQRPSTTLTDDATPLTNIRSSVRGVQEARSSTPRRGQKPMDRPHKACLTRKLDRPRIPKRTSPRCSGVFPSSPQRPPDSDQIPAVLPLAQLNGAQIEAPILHGAQKEHTDIRDVDVVRNPWWTRVWSLWRRFCSWEDACLGLDACLGETFLMKISMGTCLYMSSKRSVSIPLVPK